MVELRPGTLAGTLCCVLGPGCCSYSTAFIELCDAIRIITAVGGVVGDVYSGFIVSID